MHVERGYAGEDLAVLRWDGAAGTQSQCDHLHGSHLVISAPKVRYVREDLAALRLDAAAGGQAQYDHLRSDDLVIRACGKCGMPGRTLQLFDGMQQQGFKLNVSPTRQRSGDQGMWKVQ